MMERTNDRAASKRPRRSARPADLARLRHRRLQRGRRQRVSGVRGQPGARRPRRRRHRRQPQLSRPPSPPRDRHRGAVRPAARDHPDARNRSAGIPREPGQPLLLLQARALHAPHADRGGPSRDRRRRQQRRRSRRLSPGPAGGARVRRPQPARRSRSAEGRNPRAVPARRAADLGRAGIGLPLVAHSVSLRSHRREAAHDRTGRRGDSRARLSRVPRPASRRDGADRDRPRRNAARARSRDRAPRWCAR